MKKIFTLLLFLGVTVFGQFNTASIDGAIGSNEYGNHSDGNNRQISDAIYWYVTWNADNLYFAITGADIGQGCIIYLDKDALTPINSGSNSEGTNVGNTYDGVGFSELPFRADLVIYVKNTYREYRTANSSNGWSNPTAAFGNYQEHGINKVREFSIPWSVVGGRPSSFAWFGTISDGSTNAYADVPPAAAISYSGSNLNSRYYIVNSTAAGSSTKPFSRDCYVFTGSSNKDDFDGISVYDFTMNTNSYSITRGGSGATWYIGGKLLVNNGSINSGAVGNPIEVSGDVQIGSNGTLTLSSSVGGDLKVGGNFVNNGTLTANGRLVLFNGTASQDISGSGAGNFAYVDINNSNGVTLNRSLTIDNQLKLSNGNLTLGANNLTLGSSMLVNSAGNGGSGNFTNSNMIIAGSTGTVSRTVGGTAVVFPVGYSATNYNPVTITNTGTSRAFAVKAKSTPSNAGYNVKYVNCFWDISPDGADVNASLVFQWTSTQEGEGFTRGDATLHIGRWTGTVWEPKLATLAGSDPYTATASGFTSFSEFGIGSNGALPVELTSFNAAVRNGMIDLKWETATEVNNYGFEIERKSATADWSKIGFVEGHGSTNSPKYYSYSDKPSGTGKFSYRLKQIDNDGAFEYSPIVEVLVDNLPNGFVLEQNYPNPFNPETSIRFALKEDTKASLKVFNAMGEEVATLFDGIAEAGRYYDVKFSGNDLSSGFYIYKLVAGDYVSVKKMLLMK